MNILVVATWFPTAEQPIGGIFIAKQAEALAAHHDVSVVASTSTAEANTPLPSLDAKVPYDIFRERVPSGTGYLKRYCQSVYSVAKKTRPDVIHAHVTNPGGLAAVVVGWLTRTPVVITEHFGPFSACMRTVRDRMKMGFALRNAHAVIAVSNALKTAIRSHGIRRGIDVVPNVVDTDVFHPDGSQTTHDASHRVLFAGRLGDEQKNLPSLLRAIASLRRHDDYRLTVIGDGIHRARYRDMASSLGLGDCCDFIAHVSQTELNRQFQHHDVLVLPSLGETFGCVLAEAIAAGCPVVATDCGGPRDIVTPETGRLVPVNDDAELGEAIHHVCSNRANFDPQRLSTFAQHRFGPDAVVDRLEEIYHRVLGRAGGLPFSFGQQAK